MAEVAVDGTAVPFDDDGEGDGDGVPLDVKDPPATAVAAEEVDARGVEVRIPPPESDMFGSAAGTIGFSWRMCASHSSFSRSISDTLARKNEWIRCISASSSTSRRIGSSSESSSGTDTGMQPGACCSAALQHWNCPLM